MKTDTVVDHAPRTKNGDLRDLLIKSGVSLILKVAGGAGGFAMSVIIGRQLGATGAGTFFLALAIVTLLSAFSRLGFDQAVTRFVSEANAKHDMSSINGLYRIVLTRILLVSTCVAFMVWLSSSLLSERLFADPLLSPVLSWMSWAIIGFSIAWIHSHFFQGLGEIKRFQLFQNLGITLAFLVILGIADLVTTQELTVTMAAQFFVAASCSMALVSLVWWRFGHEWYSWSNGQFCSQTLGSVATSMFGMVLLYQTMNWLPQLVLGAFREAGEVGIYSAAFRTANLTSLALLGVNSVVFPRFAALYSAGEVKRLKSICQSSTLVMVAICIPFLALLLIVPERVLTIFGAEFIAASTSLRILSLGQLVNVSTGSVGGLLLMTGHQKAALKCGILSFIVQAVLLFALVPTWGANGAAISQAVGVSVSMLAMSVVCYRALGFSPIGGISLGSVTQKLRDRR